MTRPTGVVLAAALAAACAGAPPERPATDFAPFTSFDVGGFRGAPGILTGFAAPDDDAMRVGDAALLAVELHRGGEVERQLLLLEAHAVPDEVVDGVRRSRFLRSVEITSTREDGVTSKRSHTVSAIDVQLTRFTPDGEQVQRSVARLWEEALSTGWWPCSYRDPPKRDGDLSFALSMTLQELANSDPNLKDLLFRVVDAPSLWSIATSFGVNVNIRWIVPEAPVRVDAPWLAGETRCAPMDMRINGTTASWVDMLVSQPRGATKVCGGLIGAIARHPTEAGRIAVVRLLATRRGPAANPR